VQLQNQDVRRVALVVEPRLQLLARYQSVHELADLAIASRKAFTQLIREARSDEWLDYDPVYQGRSEWKLLPPVDHPAEASRCLVTGTGLTHTASAKNRNAMHAHGEALTDSMRMFQWGLAGGRPESGRIGAAPEWFYKGTGSVLRGHNAPLVVPPFAEDGGEEPEVAGIYLIGTEGRPYRIGFAVGNEFSDHAFEKRNYMYLAGSKLRNCSLGPELVVDHEFRSVPGRVSIERDQTEIWSADIHTGDAQMCHSLANLEHHHFKFPGHRQPGDVHVHFFGADAFSFGAGLRLQHGDVMTIRFDGFGRPLRNPLHVDSSEDQLVEVQPLA
jgi:hypothetical protein